jgi:acyl carrier protein
MTVTNSNSKSNQEVEKVQNWLIDKLADQLSLDSQTISISESLTRYGLDSIDAVTMVGDLEDWLDLELPSTLFWDYPTIEKSSQYLAENYDLSESLSETKTSSKPAEKAPEPVGAASSKGGLFGRLMGR